MPDRILFQWLEVIHDWQVATYDLVKALTPAPNADPALIAKLQTKLDELKEHSDRLKAALAAAQQP